VRLLLDTHILIWWDEGERLSAAANAAIRDADQVYVSAVSGWEIAIKQSLDRIKSRRTVAEAVEDSGFEELPLYLRHGEALRTLPRHHRDPFDRLLLAQAIEDRLTIVTRDAAFKAYRTPLIAG